MRPLVIAMIVLGSACTATSVPGPTSPSATSADTHAPEPSATAPASNPASTSTTTVPPTTVAPAPADPLELSDTQLARARAVQKHVIAAADAYDVDPNLINGIIWAESKFEPSAKNRSGARGLMQLMPGTAKAMAKALGRPSRPSDPAFSVHAGTYLFAKLREKFDGDEELALFGYARGSGGVRKWQASGQPMPEGIRKFIARVRRAQATFASLGFPAPKRAPGARS